MELSPREKDKLLVFTAALLAERRMAKGLKLNYPEAVAFISAGIMEGARGGRTVAELMDYGRTLLSADDVMVPRQDIVEVRLRFPEGPPAAIRVLGPAGEEVPAQLVARRDDVVQAVFLADLPPVGFAVYEVRPREETAIGASSGGELRVWSRGLENHRYRVEIDESGDLAAVWDKRLGRHLLGAPAGLELLAEPRNARRNGQLGWASFLSAVVLLIGSSPGSVITHFHMLPPRSPM